MGMNIDEAGCDDHAFRVDLIRALRQAGSDRSDTVANEADVHRSWCASSTVEDGSVANNQGELAHIDDQSVRCGRLYFTTRCNHGGGYPFPGTQFGLYETALDHR